MIRSSALVVLALGVGGVLLSGCGQDPFPTDDELVTLQGLYNPAAPDPDPTNRFADDAAARNLGARLFSDPGVSVCGTVSCQTCHPPPAYTVSTPAAHGCGGDTARSPPTLLNVAYAKWFMWDGRKDSLWDQPSGPLTNPAEMGTTPEQLRTFLANNYGDDYEAVFGTRPEAEADANAVMANFGKAMEAYERTLIRVKSPFDEHVQHFITSVQQGHAEEDPYYAQMHVFVRRGRCAVCHKGTSLSDKAFHDLGLSEPADVDHGRAQGLDQVLADPLNGAGEYSDDPSEGAQRLTAATSDRSGTDGAFKTPSLRNVALTAPYMHNGSLATLDDVIAFYDRGGDTARFAGTRTDTIIPLYLSDAEKKALKDVLESLTGSETP